METGGWLSGACVVYTSDARDNAMNGGGGTSVAHCDGTREGISGFVASVVLTLSRSSASDRIEDSHTQRAGAGLAGETRARNGMSED